MREESRLILLSHIIFQRIYLSAKKGSDVNQENLKDKKISAQVGTLQEEVAKKITNQSIPAENVSSAIMSLNTALRNNSQHKFARGKNAFYKNSYEFLIFKF